MLADEKFNNRNPIDILLADDVLFEVLHTVIEDAATKLSSFTGYRSRLDYFRQNTFSSV
jgi:hypothetical protein